MEMRGGTVAGYHRNDGTPVTVSQLVHPWKLTFVRMLCCGDPIDTLPQGTRISAIPHLWGRPGLLFWCKLQPAGTILPEQGAVLTP